MRVSTGVEGFDQLVDGGLPKGHVYTLSGPPGAGKSTFSAQFISQCVENGERGLIVSMHETEETLIESMADYSFGFEQVMRSPQVSYLNVLENGNHRFLQPAQEGDYLTSARAQVRHVSEFLNRNNVSRLVFDSTMLLRYFFGNDPEVVMHFLTGLKQTDVTTLLIDEMTDPSSYADEHFLAHGVIFLHNFLDADSGNMQRGVQVVKMRGTDIDTDIHKLSFTDAGIRVHPDEKIEG
ncbi:MAG: ATPase domain-containing protein [Halobacteriales archaeon]|nr:ATPase domain-containing protein [Halobacteriales archaeon]